MQKNMSRRYLISTVPRIYFCYACVLTFIVYLLYQKGIVRIPSTSDSHYENAKKQVVTMDKTVPNRPIPNEYDVKVQPFIPQRMTISINRDPEFDYKAAMMKLNDEKVAQDDPRLIQLIRDYYIDKPSEEPYQLKNTKSLDYSMGQAPFVDSRLNYMNDGFYIECGALDGETRSNTLFFEKVRRWNGLLVEADPKNYEKLKKKHRKAFAVNACLNTEPHPAMRRFKAQFNIGRLGSGGSVDVQCFPLFSLLLALNQTTVDYFSLDVEGDELEVLQTIPFNKTNIRMMSVEFVHDKGGKASIKTFGESQGYDALLQVSHFSMLANDIIFRKKGLKH